MTNRLIEPIHLKRYTAGFSLIELMVAVLVIGILAAIAYPSYSNFMLKSHRTDAYALMSQLQITLERCYAQNFSYSAACGSLPTFPQTTAGNTYSITLSNLSSSTYTLTATAIGNQLKDTTCTTMTVNQANVKTATDSSNASQAVCWNPN